MSKYSSLHDYLDAVFADVEYPSDKDIIQAKTKYWRLYRDIYQKGRRVKIKEFTLGFDKEAIQLIHSKRGTHNVSEFLYHCVFSTLEGNTIIDTKLLGNIHSNQMQIITQLEELLDTEESKFTESLLENMEALELQIKRLSEG